MIGPRIIVGALAGAALAATPAYLLGRSHGFDAARISALESTITVDNARRDVDAEIHSRAAVDLCRSFGLRPEAIPECMRRVEQAYAAGTDGGDDHHH